MTAKQENLMRGTWLLTLTSLLVKILSAIYRVPYQNLVGDEGFYVYQQVYPLYGLAMTFSLVGLPVFLSKLVAEQETSAAKGQVVRAVFPLLLWFSLLLFALCFFGRQQLAGAMGDSELAPVIGVVAWTFLLIPLLASYRGFFQGSELMAPTAYSQLWEQLLRVGIILLAGLLFQRLNWSLYEVGAWAMSGALVGGLLALVILRYYQRQQTVVVKLRPAWGKSWQLGQSWQYLPRLLVEGGLLCGYSSLLIMFQLLDSFLVKNMLVKGGLSHFLAKVTKGAYDRGQPLLQVGMVLAVALTTAFLPRLRRYYIEGHGKLYQQRSEIFFRLALTLGAAASAGLICVLPSLNHGLFGDQQQQLPLQVLMGSVVLMTLVLVMQILYQSQNQWRWPLIALAGSLIAKSYLSWFLTPRYGTVGTSWATLGALTVCLVILLSGYPRVLPFLRRNRQFIWKLASALCMMVVGLLLVRYLLAFWLISQSGRGWHLLAVVVEVLVGLGLYVLALWQFKVLRIREWLFIPLGSRLLRMKK